MSSIRRTRGLSLLDDVQAHLLATRGTGTEHSRRLEEFMRLQEKEKDETFKRIDALTLPGPEKARLEDKD